MRKKEEREFDIREWKKTRRKAFDLNEIGLRFKHIYGTNIYFWMTVLESDIMHITLGYKRINCLLLLIVFV